MSNGTSLCLGSLGIEYLIGTQARKLLNNMKVACDKQWTLFLRHP